MLPKTFSLPYNYKNHYVLPTTFFVVASSSVVIYVHWMALTRNIIIVQMWYSKSRYKTFASIFESYKHNITLYIVSS